MRHHQHTAWAWLKNELVRELGQDAADRLWAEYAARAKADQRHNERLDAPELLVRLEARRLRTTDAAEQRRLVKRIVRLQSLIESPEEDA